jgi:hypothetical protein
MTELGQIVSEWLHKRQFVTSGYKEELVDVLAQGPRADEIRNKILTHLLFWAGSIRCPICNGFVAYPKDGVLPDTCKWCKSALDNPTFYLDGDLVSFRPAMRSRWDRVMGDWLGR